MERQPTFTALVARLYLREKISVFYHALLGVLTAMGTEVAVILALCWVLRQRKILDLPGDFWLPQLLLAMLTLTALLYALNRLWWGVPSRLQMLQRLDQTHHLLDLLGTAYSLTREKHKSSLAPVVIDKASDWLDRYLLSPPPLLRADRKWWIFPILALAFIPWAADNSASGEDLLPRQIAAQPSELSSRAREPELNTAQKTEDRNDGSSGNPKLPISSPEKVNHPDRKKVENIPGSSEKQQKQGQDQDRSHGENQPDHERDENTPGATEEQQKQGRNQDGATGEDQAEEGEPEDQPGKTLTQSGLAAKNQSSNRSGDSEIADIRSSNSHTSETWEKPKRPERSAPQPVDPRQNSSHNRGGRDGGHPDSIPAPDGPKVDAPPSSIVPHHIRPLFGEGENWLSQQWVDVWDPDGQPGESELDPAVYHRFVSKAETFLCDSHLPEKHRKSIHKYFALIRPDK